MWVVYDHMWGFYVCLCVCSLTSLGTRGCFFLCARAGYRHCFLALVWVWYSKQSFICFICKNYRLFVFFSYSSSSVSTGIPSAVERDSSIEGLILSSKKKPFNNMTKMGWDVGGEKNVANNKRLMLSTFLAAFFDGDSKSSKRKSSVCEIL